MNQRKIGNYGAIGAARSLAALLVLIGVLIGGARAAEGPKSADTEPGTTAKSAKKLPVPDVAAQTAAMKVVKDIFGEEYKAARTATQKKELALKLLDKAKTTEDDPAGRFVLLRLSRDIAAQASDAITMLDAIDELDRTYRIDAGEMKAAAIEKCAATARSADDHQALAEAAAAALDGAIATDNFTAAKQLADTGLVEARKAKDPALVKRLTEHCETVKTLSRAYEEVQKALQTLATTPEDARANLTVGRYKCFRKDDWESGLPCLVLSGDAELQPLAKKDLAGPASPTAQMVLGDGWWELAEKQQHAWAKKSMYDRARHWYEKAQPGLTGLVKARVQKRLAEVTAVAASTSASSKEANGAERKAGGWTDLLKGVDPARDAIAGSWVRRGSSVSVDRATSVTRLVLPREIEGSFDLTVKFTRREGDNDVGVVVPVGSHACAIMLSGFRGKVSGIRYINNKDAPDNITASPGALINNQQYTMAVSVRVDGENAKVGVMMNGRPYFGWSGKHAELSVGSAYAIPNGQHIAIGGCSSIEFDAVRIRSTSASAKFSTVKER